jgi:protein-S-isoprenylcysteine O-methyltransferase Ste14
MQQFLLAAAASLTLAYYAPSAAATLSGHGGGEMHWPSRLAMYATYGFFFAASTADFISSGASSAINYLGFLPAAAGLVLHFKSVRGLGRSYSAGITFSKKPRLVTTGVYAIARHPLYSSAALFFLGLAVLLLSTASLVAYALVVAYLAYRVRVEETILRKKFGKPYETYARAVPSTVFGWLLRQ